MPQMLGLDLGTTFFKGAVLDLDARSLSHIRRVAVPKPIPGLPAGHHELAPQAVLTAVRQLIGELLVVAPDANGLLLTSQMHCVVLTDPRGRTESNIITWKDQRGQEIFADLQREVSEAEQAAIGRELRLGLPITTLSWLQRRGQLPVDAYAVSLPDFVLARLCQTTPATEATNAAAHGLFHLALGSWHWDVIHRLGLNRLQFPNVRPVHEPVGQADIDGHRLTCFPPVGDQQAALLGVGLRERELSLNISTGSQVSLLSREPTAGAHQVRPYLDGQFLRTVVQVPAGRSLAVLMNLVTELGGGEGAWDRVAAATEEADGGGLDANLAFFAGPFGSSGSIGNIREDHFTVANLFAAGFRWMADRYRECAERLSPNRTWDQVVFSGGVAQRFGRLRREILERMGSPPMRVCETEEDTLNGLLNPGGPVAIRRAKP